MADVLTSNLYPPTIPTYGEPFIITVGDNNLKNTGSCTISFSISKYNTAADILTNCVQVTVFKQNTNLSALNSELYPCGIMIKPTTGHNGIYSITIDSSDIEGSGFQINTFYRVQIRLTKSTVPEPTFEPNGRQNISQWLNEYINNFSEWSTVCLIRGILQPVLKIKGIDTDNLGEPVNWKTGNVDIVGKLYFLASPIVEPSPEVPIGEEIITVNYIPETDYLKEYSIKLYDRDDNLIFDSGVVYADNYIAVNEINYTIKRIFKDGEQYKLSISYLTKVGYSETKEYILQMLDDGVEKLNVIFTSYEDNERGRITLRIQNVISDAFNGNLVIRRSEGDTNFTVWEDVANISVENQTLDVTWHDYTVQSGKWYRYGVQVKTIDKAGNENRGILTIYKKDLMVEFEDIFLNADNSQICIRYNPQISSFQHTIAENKIDTIGSKYPFIKRNGNMDYKQFPISGMITYFMDNYDNFEKVHQSIIRGPDDQTLPPEERIITDIDPFNKKTESKNIEDGNSLFTSKEEIYGEELLSLYDIRMEENNSNTLDTVIYEKDFRDKVKDFLYKNNVKLFRSATEGNILIKLMNITFTPNQTLGRKVWSFNATAYEIDECSIENYDKYNIQKIGSALKHFEYINNYLGQLKMVVPAGQNVINILEDEYQKYCKQNYTAAVDKIKYLRIQFNGKPYLVNLNNRTPAQSDLENNTMMGYIVTLGKNDPKTEGTINFEETIVVSSSGVYELKHPEVDLNIISFPVDTDVTIDYELVLSQTAEARKSIRTFSYKKVIGQLRDTFKSNRELVSELRRKYNSSYEEWYQELVSVNGMRIEADEGTIIYVKEADEGQYQKHIIGPTESLDFYDPESVINGVYIYGMHLLPMSEKDFRRAGIAANKFVDSDILYESIEAIQDPQRNTTYLIGESAANANRVIYYRDNFYNIDNNNDIECPVAAMVDYYCEYVKGYYAK